VLQAIPNAGVLSYDEGLLIGYRGYDRAGTQPHFAFGHGLGYTSWAYESVSRLDDLTLEVVVRNTGSRPGREVVQAYVEPAVADDGRPLRTLAAFTAVTAGPGETVTGRLALPRRAFARFDEVAGDWVWPGTEFTVRVGRSSRDLRLGVTVCPNGQG
jgi:beta-glucosidase